MDATDAFSGTLSESLAALERHNPSDLGVQLRFRPDLTVHALLKSVFPTRDAYREWWESVQKKKYENPEDSIEISPRYSDDEYCVVLEYFDGILQFMLDTQLENEQGERAVAWVRGTSQFEYHPSLLLDLDRIAQSLVAKIDEGPEEWSTNWLWDDARVTTKFKKIKVDDVTPRQMIENLYDALPECYGPGECWLVKTSDENCAHPVIYGGHVHPGWVHGVEEIDEGEEDGFFVHRGGGGGGGGDRRKRTR